ncbi:hypothetical protein J6590_086526 [Homalodisca vitripennis]|nr:hypothetical protein J6590_086526 [Homalodisca vitripennis]
MDGFPSAGHSGMWLDAFVHQMTGEVEFFCSVPRSLHAVIAVTNNVDDYEQQNLETNNKPRDYLEVISGNSSKF